MIEQIHIENFKSIRSAIIPMRNLNVLIGSNGVGKSNFISFFEMVAKLYNKELNKYIMNRGGIDRILYQGSKHSSFICGLIDFGNTNAFFFKLNQANDNAYIEYTGDYFNNGKDKTKDYPGKWNKNSWDENVKESDIQNNKTWRADYIKNFLKGYTIYHFHDSSKTAPMRQPCDIGDNEYLRHDASNLAAYLYRLQESEPQTFKLIEGVVKSILPYFKRFNLRPDPLKENNHIKLEWEDVDSDMYLDAFSFSDGAIRFIALVVVLLQPNAPSTIIIDEPELGLHPSAINKLAALVKRAAMDTQIIIATQSVNLVNCFDPEDILVVDRKDGQSFFNRLSSDELSSWLEEYSIGEIWEKNIIGGRP